MPTTERATIKCTATFSDNSEHRYSLTRVWDKNKPQALVISISPSEAFNVEMDLTTILIQNNLHNQNFGGFCLVNLISKIGVDAKKVKETKDLWNKETDQEIVKRAGEADSIIVAWGSFANTRQQYREREETVLNLLKPFEDKTFEITDGAERFFLHPLTPAIRNGWVLSKLKTQEKAK